MARGFFFRWRAERIAPGIYKGTFSELFGGHAGDMIEDSDEVLSDRAAFVLSIKRVRTNSLYFTYLMTGQCSWRCFSACRTMNDENAFIYVMVISFIAFFAALFASFELLSRAENLPPPRPFAKKVAVETTEPVQRYAAPHFSDAPAGGDNADLRHCPQRTAGSKRRQEVKDDMVFGVINFTTQGLVFLPDAPIDNAELRAMGRVVVELAANAHPALEALRDAVMDKVDVPETFPQWMSKALGHPTHFAIAWSDLVEAGYDPRTRETTWVEGHRHWRADDVQAGWPEQRHRALPVQPQTALRGKQGDHRGGAAAAIQADRGGATPHFHQIYGDKGDYAAELHKAVILKMSSSPQIDAADKAEIDDGWRLPHARLRSDTRPGSQGRQDPARVGRRGTDRRRLIEGAARPRDQARSISEKPRRHRFLVGKHRKIGPRFGQRPRHRRPLQEPFEIGRQAAML